MAGVCFRLTFGTIAFVYRLPRYGDLFRLTAFQRSRYSCYHPHPTHRHYQYDVSIDLDHLRCITVARLLLDHGSHRSQISAPSASIKLIERYSCLNTFRDLRVVQPSDQNREPGSTLRAVA